ncbi:MAG: hypothetical protein FWF29_04900 [Treponema sp.]|nr:hypothetical protein [Treponema sp.]
MKTGLQKTGMALFFICGVFMLVYAMGFVSAVYVFFAYGNKQLLEFYNEMQAVNKGLLWKAIAVILLALFLYILELNRHPAGPITLILTVIVCAAGLVISVQTLALLAGLRREYSGLDLTVLKRYIDRGTIRFKYSTFVYDMGLALYAALALVSVFTAAAVTRTAMTVRGVFSRDTSAQSMSEQGEPVQGAGSTDAKGKA